MISCDGKQRAVWTGYEIQHAEADLNEVCAGAHTPATNRRCRVFADAYPGDLKGAGPTSRWTATVQGTLVTEECERHTASHRATIRRSRQVQVWDKQPPPPITTCSRCKTASTCRAQRRPRIGPPRDHLRRLDCIVPSRSQTRLPQQSLCAQPHKVRLVLSGARPLLFEGTRSQHEYTSTRQVGWQEQLEGQLVTCELSVKGLLQFCAACSEHTAIQHHVVVLRRRCQ